MTRSWISQRARLLWIHHSFEFTKPSPSNPIGVLLNEAWKKFWAVPYDQFKKWEEEQLQSMRNAASGKVAVGAIIENYFLASWAFHSDKE